MQGLWKATWVASLLCMAPCLGQCEPDYILPGGPPPTSTSTIVLNNPGKPLRAPTLLSSVSSHHHHHQKPRTKIVESYISSEFTVFGGGPPIHRRPPPRHTLHYRLPHPNDIPRGQPQKPFEVVRAPVIYHQTVTDTDVTRALADAFDVVEKLRKPGNKPKALPQDDSPITHNIEFLNHRRPQNTATTTTTIVEAPQHLNFDQQQPRSQYQQSPAVTLGQVTLVSTSDGQELAQASDDVPPPGAIATSATVDDTNAGVLRAPTTSTSPASAPKLIIPSQPHITTLEEAVQSVNPQVRTIIQPVYIPYPVDQNGQPIGPLPDYHSMDFGALLSAQTQILAAMSGPAPRVQLVEASHHSHQPQLQQQQQYYVQADQSVGAADVSSSGSEPSPTSHSKTRKRIPIARKRNPARRI